MNWVWTKYSLTIIWGGVMNDLRIFVEGNDDQRFIENIIFPYILNKKPFVIFTIKYAKERAIFTDKAIQTLKAKNQSYILLGDYDLSDKCITLKKEDLITKFNHLNSDSIFIVKDEIESWFLSGVDTDLDQFREFSIPDDTEGITKEMFDSMLENSHFNSRIDLMMEISKTFNFSLAVKRNKSFKYFLEKLNKMI